MKIDHKKETIVVDVDNVVVGTGELFVEHLLSDSRFCTACTRIGVDPYTWAMTYYDPLTELGLSDAVKREMFGWWGRRDLYDDLLPIEDSQDILETLSAFYNIVFVSHVEGEHGKSKVDFLKKYFPFMSGYAATRQKNIVRSSYNIDDRVIHLNNLAEGTTPLLFESPWGNPDHCIQTVRWGDMLSKIKI